MSSNFIPSNPYGRPKGSKTKSDLFTHKELAQVFEKLKFNPLEEAVALYRHRDTEPREKALIIKDLLQYCYPKRRTVEVSGEVNHTSLNISWDAPSQDKLIDAHPIKHDRDLDDTLTETEQKPE